MKKESPAGLWGYLTLPAPSSYWREACCWGASCFSWNTCTSSSLGVNCESGTSVAAVDLSVWWARHCGVVAVWTARNRDSKWMGIMQNSLLFAEHGEVPYIWAICKRGYWSPETSQVQEPHLWDTCLETETRARPGTAQDWQFSERDGVHGF